MSLGEFFRLQRFRPTPLDQILDPGPEGLKRLTPRDLARYKAGWKAGSEHWILADAEQRRRESWSGPMKVSLGLSSIAIIVSLIALLTGCSSVQSRMDSAPNLERTTSASLASLQGCITAATARENVSYLPRATGGTFKSSSGPLDYVAWLINVEDLGTERRVAIRAVNSRMGRNVAHRIAGCF